MDILHWTGWGIAIVTSLTLTWETRKSYKKGFKDGSINVLNQWKETMRDE